MAVLSGLSLFLSRDVHAQAPSSEPPAPALPPPSVSASASSPSPDGAPGASAEKKRLLRIAVYDLAVDGVEPRVGKLVTNQIVVELRKLQGVSVVSMEEVRAMLRYEADKQLLGCTAGKPCVSAVGEALGVDELIVGELVGAIGDGAGESVISLRRIDQANARTVESTSNRLAAHGGEEFLASVGPAVAKLYPSTPLKEGRSRGVAPEVALQVNPPPLPPWATVTTGVVAGVLLVAGVVAGASALSEQTTFQALTQEAKARPVPAALLVGSGERAQAWAGAANGLYVGAVLVGIGAAVMTPFTDWSGAGDAVLE